MRAGTLTRPRRSLLFAPGNRAEVHAKALASGADIVCIDLEDAVPPHAKAEARQLAIAFLTGAEGPERVVRINSTRTIEGLRDLVAIIEAKPPAGVIFLPKVSTADEVRTVDELLTEAGLGLSIAVLIESLEGVENVRSIVAASPRIVFAMFGGADLSAELGVAIAHEPLLYARSRLVHAARFAGIDCLDVPSLDFREADSVRRQAIDAKALGFTGKGVIHPANVAVVNPVFSPTSEEIERARTVVKAYVDSPNGLAIVDGKLVEKPVVRSMQRILALADIVSHSSDQKVEP